MIDPTTAGSPDWWLIRLGKQLDRNAEHYRLLERYYTGDHPLPEGDRRARELFRNMQRKARTNYCQLIVDAPRERLKVVGFRTGGTGSDDTDREAWKIWQANKLDANAGLVHTTALKYGIAYVIVGANKADSSTPIITVEDPCEVIHDTDPVNWRKVRAALKVWFDDVAQAVFAVVYLPTAVHYYRSVQKVSDASKLGQEKWSAGWWRLDPDRPAAKNPLGEVPVVPFVNRPDMKGRGSGEFEGVVDIQDRINHEVLDRMVISKMQAYRQRWAKGVSLEDEEGNPTQPFVPGADLLWAVEDDKAEFGDFAAADLSQLLAATRDDVQDMASISKTPPHYLLSGIVNASGDALAAAEIGLVSKVLDAQVELGESWEHVNRLAGLYTGRTVPVDAEVIWRDAQYRTVAELASAAVQYQAAGVPWRQRMRLLGYSPPEIDRMEADRAADALLFAQYPQLEPPGTPVRYTAAAIPADATGSGRAEATQRGRLTPEPAGSGTAPPAKAP